MPLTYKIYHFAQCDCCETTTGQNYDTQKSFINELRNDGWSVSEKRVLCPICKKKLNSNVCSETVIVVSQNVKENVR